MSRLIVVQGPTAAGKTAVAIGLARHYSTVVVSADSRQFYREMTIGTAVPSVDELTAAHHYFIQDRSIHTPLSAGGFETEALHLIESLFTRHDNVILVGGSGLYVDALLFGLDPLPSSEEIRGELNNIYTRDGLEPLLEVLKMIDPIHYNMVDRSNPARVIRAIEVCRASGMPYSNLRTSRRAVRDFDVLRLVVDMPRADLYERINHRVDCMIEAGLEAEAESLRNYRDMSALRTVGYSEFFDYFDGTISREQCIEKIKQHTRNYAKRQLTWLAREKELPRFLPSDMDRIISYADKNGCI